MPDPIVDIPARIYRHHDTDPSLEHPAEGFGGWSKAQIPVDLSRTALVVMHAWDPRTAEGDPEWWRVVEYLPRAKAILETVFPPLLTAARRELTVLHVVGGGHDYYSHLPGYQKAVVLAGQPPSPRQIRVNESHKALSTFRSDHIFPGAQNKEGVTRSQQTLDFAPQARPLPGEGIAENAEQLLALCEERGIDHLIYVGFAINWCLLMSPGGMVDMRRHGFLCSTIEEAVTAVENRETARGEREKMQALWRVALEFGFVFGLDEFLTALAQLPRPLSPSPPTLRSV